MTGRDTSEEAATVGQMIATARRSAGFSNQDTFARALGVSDRRTVSRWENGNNYPNPENADAIERVTAGRVTASEIVRQTARELRDSLEPRVARLEAELAALQRRLSEQEVTLREVAEAAARREQRTARAEAATRAQPRSGQASRPAAEPERLAPQAHRRGRG